MYRILRFIWGAGIRAFFRTVQLEGVENIPATGGVLFVSNHVNAFVDGIMFIALLKRPVRITAKASLKKNPLLGALLKGIGAITFQRREDGESQTGNAGSLERALRALVAGEQVLIFPEGFSHSDGTLRPFKKGAAHLALDAAEKKANFCVIPVGIVYLEKHQFRSDVLLRFGKPITPAEISTLGSTDKLTNVMRVRIQELYPELAPSSLVALRWAAEVTLSRLGSPTRIGEEERSLVPLVERIKKLAALRKGTAKETVATVEGRAFQLYGLTGNGVIRPHELFMPLSAWRAAVFFVRELELILIALPFAAWGLLNTLPAYLLTRFAVRKTAKDDDHVATHAIFLGAPIFLLFFALQIAAVEGFAGLRPAVVYAFTLPYCCSLGVLYSDRIRDACGRARSFFGLVGKPALRDEIGRQAHELSQAIERLSATNDV